MAKEIELKLVLDPAHTERFLQSPVLKTWAHDKPSQTRLVSTYFDTADFALKKRGIGFRVRRKGDVWLQTLKMKGSEVGGLHSRPEYEYKLREAQPDLSLLSQTPLAELFDLKELAQRLKPVFVTDFQRNKFLLHLEQETEVEVALDRGFIIHGQERVEICEAELELKRGYLGPMLEVALQLAMEMPFYLENVSKAARGYALIDPPKWDAQDLNLRAPDAKAGLGKVLRDWAATLLAVFQQNEKALLAEDCLEAAAVMERCLDDFQVCLALAEDVPYRQVLEEGFGWLKSQLSALNQFSRFERETAQLRAQSNSRKKLENGLQRLTHERFVSLRSVVRQRRYAAHWLRVLYWIHGS